MSKCGAICEVFSRVCGYFRPVTNWNKGKQEEFKERKVFEVTKNARKNPDGKSPAGVWRLRRNDPDRGTVPCCAG